MKTLELNPAPPRIMHIDLNSCFATIEQQANPLIRHKPVVVAAYGTGKGFILSPSVEAKKIGIKMGMNVNDAKKIYPKVIVITPDPPKYRDVHIKFRNIFSSYSPKVVPKSIDEAIIDFMPVENLYGDLMVVAREIKYRMKKEIGEWIKCSIGIGPNRFLAKTGASYRKPEGLTLINHKNVQTIYNNLQLIDLHGIGIHNEARLNINGIFTPLQFLHTSSEILQKKVFRSVEGHYWFLRLRGWETDDREFGRKSFGQQYALGKATANPRELSQLIMKLCEKMGRRLRHAGFCAQGIHVACVYKDHTFWHKGQKFNSNLYTTKELYNKAQLIFNLQPERKVVGQLAISCFDLRPNDNASQISLFDTEVDKLKKVSTALDQINDKYGEYTIISALMMGMEDTILDRIAFGRIRELETVDTAYVT